VRVYHARTENLEPALALAELSALAAAGEAGDVDFGRRLGEREVVRTEANLCRLAEHGLSEGLECALEVAHRDSALDDQALELVEHRRVRRVDRVRTVDSAGRDHADRRLLLLHYADLHRRSLRAQQNVVGDVEGVLRVARRMILG